MRFIEKCFSCTTRFETYNFTEKASFLPVLINPNWEYNNLNIPYDNLCTRKHTALTLSIVTCTEIAPSYIRIVPVEYRFPTNIMQNKLVCTAGRKFTEMSLSFLGQSCCCLYIRQFFVTKTRMSPNELFATIYR